MSTTPKLKFKKIYFSELIPNGYRLATVEEVRKDFEAIKRRGLLEFRKEIWGEEGRLLDGRILAGHRLEHTLGDCNWCLVVKEKERDEQTGVWKKKLSACYLPNGNLLRTHLYDGINLSQGRDTALALASINADAEVICWLLKTTNPEEFRLPEKGIYFFNESCEIVKCLLASKFPLRLTLEQDNEGATTLDHLIRLYHDIDHFGSSFDHKKIGFTELLIEVYSTDIVHCTTRDGMSFLDKVTSEAVNNKKWICVLTKLLSVSQVSVENQVSKIKDCFGDVLIEAVERGYVQLVEDLLKLKDCIEQLVTNVALEVARGAICKGHPQCLQNMLNLLKVKAGNELQQDKNEKTLFHYAAESGNEEVSRLLAEAYEDEYRVKKRDKWGRTFLHWVALIGQADLCKVCIDEWKLKVDAKDNLGQNSLHLAAKGNNGHLVVDILVDSSSVDLIYAMDGEGRIPLHFASAKGNITMVEKLLNFVKDSLPKVKKMLQQPDGFGHTALQMAACGGHTRVVQRLLKEDCDPLLQRDVHGSTALHYATQVEDREVALAISQSLLNKYKNESSKKSLLLWASAVGIGTAEERQWIDPLVKDFLVQEKARDRNHLLRAAVMTDNMDMAWELLNRGADFADIADIKRWEEGSRDDLRWTEEYGSQEKVNRGLVTVIKEIEIANEQGRDKPSLEDNLGRNVFAEGLAALFLNKFVESPITVGISGEWGMGKSSLMIQAENILLMAASQLSFPNLVPFENFNGAKKMSLSTKGRKIYTRMKNAANKLFPDNSLSTKDRMTRSFSDNSLSTKCRKIYTRMKNGISKLLAFAETGNQLVKLLEEYHPEYHAIYKSLACMDVHNQMLRSDAEGKNQFQPMREAPRILTIRYNAWHYRDEHEAWAGLAVTITKEIEHAMTKAQKISTSWRYSWAKNGVNICMQIFLPSLLATFLAGWVAWLAWTLLREAKFKDLKYGSIPFTVIAIVWGVLKSVFSVVKPVSTQMMGYINSPDHTARLGYQQQVISDINFLKGELGKKPHRFFSFISGEWCRNWFGLHPDNVENTCVPKFSPASEDQLRMITFVDDLDRCDEKVVLQILSAINLVLAECKINVILGVDKKMIQRAVERHFEDHDDRDIADKFICKIIQIPLSLPDPTVEESDKFLQHYLGYSPPIRTATRVEDGERIDYGDIDTDNDDEEIFDKIQSSSRESAVLEITCCDRLQTSRQGIIKKVHHWSACFFQMLCLLACNLSSELRQVQDEINEKEIRPLTFSKGARLTREMLLSKYSPEEAETLYKLKDFATGSQKLPREWKRFLDYRKFACNSLSMIGEVYKLPGWRVELVAWTFICWQWKHEMNTLIKGWHKYANVKSKDKGKAMEDGDEVKEHYFGPSLKHIVMNYVIELKESQHLDIEAGLDKDRKLNSGTIEMQEGLTIVEESQTQYSKSLNLLKALHDVQDVSMKGIQLFQQFRLHCETDNLPWPLPESNAMTYNRLMSEMKI